MASQTGKTLVRSRSGLRVMNANECLQSPLLLKEPGWIPDKECHECMNCKTKFDFIKRRHHCRRCGSCYCSKCCETRVPLPRMCFLDPVRHCKACAVLSEKEKDFFLKQLKLLQAGAQLLIKFGDDPLGSSKVEVLCQMSEDHRWLTFNPQTQLGSIDLTNILSLQLNTTLDGQGNHAVNAMAIKYRTGETSMQDVYLECGNGLSQSQSISWLTALDKAYSLMCESVS